MSQILQFRTLGRFAIITGVASIVLAFFYYQIIIPHNEPLYVLSRISQVFPIIVWVRLGLYVSTWVMRLQLMLGIYFMFKLGHQSHKKLKYTLIVFLLGNFLLGQIPATIGSEISFYNSFIHTKITNFFFIFFLSGSYKFFKEGRVSAKQLLSPLVFLIILFVLVKTFPQYQRKIHKQLYASIQYFFTLSIFWVCNKLLEDYGDISLVLRDSNQGSNL